MLNYLKINDFALIENAEVEFTGGFTVVTGESGAGKSILMSIYHSGDTSAGNFINVGKCRNRFFFR